MSAGRGIAHSEFNGSQEDPVHLLQIWILPREKGADPRYEEKAFTTKTPGLTLLVSPEGREGSLTIGQDVDLHRLLLPEGESAPFEPRRKNAWIQVVRGEVEALVFDLR